MNNLEKESHYGIISAARYILAIQAFVLRYEFGVKRQTPVSSWYNKGGKAILRIQVREPLSKFDVKHQTPISHRETRIPQGLKQMSN